MSRRILPGLLALALAASLLAAARAEASRRVVIVSFDGLRPDVMLRADAPALRSLMARGSFTMFAATTDVAVTLPSHTSMLTGVPPKQHGIHFNGDPSLADRNEPQWPTLLRLAHEAGLRVAMSAGKSKFSLFAPAGLLDESFVPPRGGTASDSAVADAAVEWLAQSPPQVLFVHLPGPDLAGHDKGWGSPEQLAAVARADRALGRVLAALPSESHGDSTMVIVSSDHGGALRTHGGLDPRSHFIPWIVTAPGVRPGHDLTLDRGVEVRTEDTFATACAWLGLVPPKPVVGRPVTAIFARPSPARPGGADAPGR